jgi:methionyl-tRNA synthetase
MSKSLGTVLDPLDAAERFGPDPLRLFLTKEIVFGSDGDFTWDRFEEKYNVDLANNLGNLVNRVTAMSERYRGGRLRGPGAAPARLADTAQSLTHVYRHAMDQLALEGGASAAFRLIDATNEFIAEREPWTLAKSEETSRDLDAVLWDASEALRIAAVLLQPIMPTSAAEIMERLGLAGERHASLAEAASWRSTGERRTVRKDALWPRLEEATPAGVVTKENPVTEKPVDLPSPEKVEGPAAPTPATGNAGASDAAAPESAWPLDARVSMDDFMKVDLRVAKVLAAERVANSKKLVKLQVDLGSEQRTLVAGIAEAYVSEALVGRHVVIVANLKPAKLMGIESNGMVLAGSPDGGKPVLLSFDEPPPVGTRVR